MPKNGKKNGKKSAKSREVSASTNGTDYPRHSVSPGEKVMLAAVNADQSEHYARKKDVEEELEVQRRRIQEL